MGAIAAGNADGTIPPWTGAANFDEVVRRQSPQSLEALRQRFEELRAKDPGSFEQLLNSLDGLSVARYPEVSAQLERIEAQLPPDTRSLSAAMRREMGGGGAEEKPLFVISRDNAPRYAAHLSDGQKAMFARYPDYRMVVYPPLRSAFFPDAIYKATARNAASAQLQGTDEVDGAVLGFPFPIPKSGAEVIWNHKMAYRGAGLRRYNNQAIVRQDGSYYITKLIEDLKFKYANIGEDNKGSRILFYYLSETLSPPRLARQLTLVHESAGTKGVGRDAWLYNPGLGRVNRAPDVGYDNPTLGTDGEQFNDQIDMYNGALDRYDWKLLGRRELYIPYNSFFLISPLVKYKDIIRPGHINQNLLRYELHRVWVVEATLRQGQSHQFKRRVFYVDEDGWAISSVDCYDNHDQLWKVQESELLTVPFIPTLTGVAEVIYDLQSGRYFVTALQNEDHFVDFTIQFRDDYFSPADLERRPKR
ncbi:MAG: DUF1329 domain-containing protein [Nevskia sp.]|nr:DUF1329 domain-containing protein [Nevskia sp.]